MADDAARSSFVLLTVTVTVRACAVLPLRVSVARNGTVASSLICAEESCSVSEMGMCSTLSPKAVLFV